MKKIKFAIELLGDTALTALVLLTILAVIARYFFNSPLALAEEVQMLCIIWTVMLGAIIASWEKAGLAVDIIFNLVGPKKKFWLERTINAITLLVMIPLAIYGWKLSIIGQNKMTNILFIPYTWINLSVFVGAIGIGLVSLIHIFTNKIEEEKQKNTTEPLKEEGTR